MNKSTPAWVPAAVLLTSLTAWSIAVVVWWLFGPVAGALTIAAVALSNLRAAAADRLPSRQKRGF